MLKDVYKEDTFIHLFKSTENRICQTVGDNKLNQGMTVIADASPDVVYLVKQIYTMGRS